MNPADIAALLYALVVLGEAASRGIQQMMGDKLSDEEFEAAWETMRQRLAGANALWQQASAGHERTKHDSNVHDAKAGPAAT